MAKISELTDGGSLLPTDFLVAVRSGGNVKVQADTINVDQIDLGDNERIRLGNSQDLQIYHDGSNSYITDSGTGNLRISGTLLQLNDASFNKYLLGSGDSVTLYHADTAKLTTTSTGIDVTGTVTADAAEVSKAQVTTNFDTSAFLRLHPSATTNSGGFTNIFFGTSTSNDYGISIGGERAGTDAKPDFAIRTHNLSGTGVQRLRIEDNGDISFYEDTGTTAKFFWDASAESLGIGTTSPDSPLEIQTATNSTSDTTYLKLFNAGENVGHIDFENGNGSLARITGTKEGAGASANDGIITFSTAFDASLSERMRIDSAGNVGIGTASPTGPLHVAGSGSTVPIKIDNTGTGGDTWRIWSTNDAASDGGGKLGFYNEDTATRAMTLDSSGNVGIGETNPLVPLHVFTGVGATTLLGNVAATFRTGSTSNPVNIQLSDGTNAANMGMTAGDLFFATASTERMRIGSTGIIYVNGDGTGGRISGDGTGGLVLQDGNGRQSFKILSPPSGLSDAMTLDASGNLLVGTTSVINTGVVSVEFTGASQNGISIKTTTASNGSKFLSFADSAGTEIGYVEENTSTSVNYSTSSDQRLKENIVDAPSASDDIDAIQVRSFDWKVNGSHQKYGMVAQELVTVAPNAVSQPEDPEAMMGVDYSKLVPMMLKEIQQLRARVAQLEGTN